MSGKFLLVALCLLFCVQGVHAQPAVTVWLDPQTSPVNVGEKATVKLLVDARNAVGGFDLTLNYDPNLISLDGWKYGSFLSKLSPLKNESTPGQLWLVSVQLGVPPVEGSGVLLELTFSGVAAGSSSLTIAELKFSDGTGNPFEVELNNGLINVVVGALPSQTSVPTQLPTGATPTLIPSPTLPSFTVTYSHTATLPALIPTSGNATATKPGSVNNTPQPLVTARPELQQTATDPHNPGVASPTAQVIPLLAGQVTPGASKKTDPFFIPVRPVSASKAEETTGNATSKQNLVLGLFIFDGLALAFVLYLVWNRRRKNREGRV